MRAQAAGVGSITDRVVRQATLVLVGALALAGVGTGAALHLQHVQGHDRGLLNTARAGISAAGEDGWRVAHGPPPDVWWVEPGDPQVPAELVARALADERPVFADLGDDRLVLLVAEFGPANGPEARHAHRVIAAKRPAVTVWSSIGAYSAIYLVLATAVGALAARRMRQVLTLALAPVGRAQEEVAAVVGLGDGKRLSVDAPAELRGLLLDVNALLDRLDASGRAQRRFTAEAAHELRTPVTALLGELEVALRRERSPEAYRVTIASARDEVERLRRIVEGLTALARLDAGEIDQRRELARAGELVDEALRAERHGALAAGVRVDVQRDDDPELDVHRALLVTALANLIRNAVRHAPGSPVDLRVHRDGSFAVFEVADRGPGLPSGDREALFDRFARSTQSRQRDPDGLGLGLPIAREIARQHGGDCVLLDRAGGGVSARLTVRVG